MFTRPENLTDDEVVGALAEGWGLRATTIAYVAAGFGSYHWAVEAGGAQWFATADPVAKRESLRCALEAACVLRDDGLTFVVAPQRTAGGGVLHALGGRYVLALYPFVSGTPHEFGSYATRAERLAALECLVALHRAPRPSSLAVDDFAITDRGRFASACRALQSPWTGGPYGEPGRSLVAEHCAHINDAFTRYDAMVPRARAARAVVTHGEPDRANTIDTAAGLVLIDWDTALHAPPERDLWALADEDGGILDIYTERTTITPDPVLLDLYRLRWSLTEIAIYVSQFHAPHADDADTRTAWLGLQGYVESLHLVAGEP